jgi:hypothetical protein
MDLYNITNGNGEFRQIYVSGSSFGFPSTIIPPRIVRFGVKLEFDRGRRAVRSRRVSFSGAINVTEPGTLRRRARRPALRTRCSRGSQAPVRLAGRR